MEVNRDDADEFLQNFFEQLESLSLSEEAEVAETTDPCNINALLEPLPSQFQKQAIPQHAPTYDAAGFLENLDQLLGPDTIYTEDQSVQIGSNKRILDVDPTQHLFSSNLNQCYMAETSTSTNPTLQTGRSPSQFSDKEGLFTVPPESIQFKPVGSSAINKILLRWFIENIRAYWFKHSSYGSLQMWWLRFLSVLRNLYTGSAVRNWCGCGILMTG
ncbi:hypothetical protein YC2023_049900 [Brassica napus]